MAKFISTKEIDINAIPGSLESDEGPQSETSLSCIHWNSHSCSQKRLHIDSPNEWDIPLESLHWINIVCPNSHLLEQFASLYKLHLLTMEDISNTEHAPKYEYTTGYGYIVIKMLRTQQELIIAEQLNIIFTDQYVITIQEDTNDVFEPIRRRLVEDLGRIRTMGTDYLVFSLLDAIIDHYVLTVESLGEIIEGYEDTIFLSQGEHVIRYIRKLKRDFADIRRFTRPVIGIIEQIMKSEPKYINDATRPFYQDLRDQIRLVCNAVDGYREMLSDQLGLYAALQANRMNEIMKVLAIISTIFIPLTFISGIYGMNFQNMPELRISWAYPVVLITMLLVAISMGYYFKVKGWISKRNKKR